MRILYLNHHVAEFGGTFFRAFGAVCHLAVRGQRVTLMTISPSRRLDFERETRLGVEILHSPDLLFDPGRTGWDLWDTLCRMAYVRRQTWDIIHAWDCRPVVIQPALYARRCCGTKQVIDWCDWWGRGRIQPNVPAGRSSCCTPPRDVFRGGLPQAGRSLDGGLVGPVAPGPAAWGKARVDAVVAARMRCESPAQR